MGKDLGDDSPAAWTQHMLKAVRNAVPRNEQLVPYGHLWSPKGQREYLIDMAISYETDHDQWHSYHGLVLACECEWGGTREALWQDFVKLADVRANLRVFIGALWPSVYAGRRKLLDECLCFLRGHRHVPEDEEFLVVLCEKKESRTARHGAWLLSRKGGVACLWEE